MLLRRNWSARPWEQLESKAGHGYGEAEGGQNVQRHVLRKKRRMGQRNDICKT